MQLNPLFSAAVVVVAVVVVVVVEHVGTSEAKKVIRTVGRGETEKKRTSSSHLISPTPKKLIDCGSLGRLVRFTETSTKGGVERNATT